MDAKLQRRVQRYGWDKAAGDYERFWAAQLKPAQDLLLTLADIQSGERVLDVACGTGLVSLRAADAAGSQGHVLGTDISEGMVQRARDVASHLGLHHATFQRMDAEALDIPDAGFNVAVCALGLMYVPDPLRALQEMRRALAPGGRAVAAVWGARKHCGWAEIFPIVESRVQSDVCPMFFRLGTGDTLAATFVEAGFTGVHEERISTVLEYENGDQAIGAAFAGGPVAMAYSRFDESMRIEAHAEYLESIVSFRRSDGGYNVPGEFVVVRGDR
ncbi:MAG: methyltransferase domain-containing protein [Acidobacteria bacterium]|nr:methyltransferase domain-containing protein [Acidobacteriota bacterium]